VEALAQGSNNTQALQELASVEALPNFSSAKRDVVQKWAKALSLPPIDTFKFVGPIPPPFMPDFSLLDWYYWQRGISFSAAQLTGRNGPMIQNDLWSLGTDFSIPVLFFEGTDDFDTPVEPARAYFEKIEAPRKEFVLFNGGDHFVPMDRPDEFLAELVTRVRPLAAQ
jgi:pimeloyl-ACP methyl ester carboxylesterase